MAADKKSQNEHRPWITPPRWMRRKWLSWMWNRQTFIFIFFLVLSTTFWVLQALNETYEQEFDVRIEMRNVPNNVVITTN